MKWLIILAGGIAVAMALIVIVGGFLPRQHTATRAVTLRQPAPIVFAAIRDFAAQPSWRTGVQAVELLPNRDGRVCYRETSRHGAITYVVLEEKPAERLVVKIADEALPFGGTWTFQLTPTDGGTSVRITENGEVKNPAFRFLARFVFGYTSTIDTYLRDLARQLGESR